MRKLKLCGCGVDPARGSGAGEGNHNMGGTDCQRFNKE